MEFKLHQHLLPNSFFLGLIDSLQDLITCLDATKQCITGEEANKRHTYCGDQLN